MKSARLAVRDLIAMNTSEEENDRRPDDAEAPILNKLIEPQVKPSDQVKKSRMKIVGKRKETQKKSFRPACHPGHRPKLQNTLAATSP
jgi:hypothetical protein